MASRIGGRVAVLGTLGVGLLIGPGVRADDLPIDRGIGRQVPNFKLKDATTGEAVSLYGATGKGPVVLAFTGTDCPVGNLYLPRLVELAASYKGRGVAFLAINSNAHETAEQVAEHAKGLGLTFPALKDPGNLVADLNFVERTCEVLVVDRRARLRYRGAIDDQYARGSRKGTPSRRYLVEALDALLADREVGTPATPVEGCPIDRAEPKVVAAKGPRVRPAPPEIVAAFEEKQGDSPVEVGEVTYAADVASILQGKCQSCHRPGQVGPFSLLSYEEARRWSASIREVVDERRMPPWHADPRYGQFENDRSLTARERATLLAWVDQGAPPGDPTDLPAPRSFPEGWGIGAPDRVFEMPEPYLVSAQGTLPYQRFRVPTGFTEDRWVRAAEARPGDRSVVHHIIVYVDDHAGPKGRRRPDAHLVAYAPGDVPSVYPPGTAKKIPAGSDLIFEVHYTPIGKVKADRSSVGLVFAGERVTRRAVTLGIAQPKFAIPPGDANHAVASSFTFPSDSHLLNFLPHMHLRGKDFLYKATYPDGSSEVLLSVPAYDFAWQSVYSYANPKAMPRGTRIDCLAHFDNSDRNPNNPDPRKRVTWGEQTWDEMMIGYIDFVDDTPVDPQTAAAQADSKSPTPNPHRGMPDLVPVVKMRPGDSDEIGSRGLGRSS